MQKHFEGAMGADDFITRMEMALFAFGFTGDNSIGEQRCLLPPASLRAGIWPGAPANRYHAGQPPLLQLPCPLLTLPASLSVLSLQPWSTCAAMRSP